MNRDEKIGKLARAFREWRGVTNAQTGKWIQCPKPSSARRVARWLEELGIDADAGLATLGALRTYAQFHAWIKDLPNAGIERPMKPQEGRSE